MNLKVSVRYLIYGVLFGLMFPIIASMILSFQEFGFVSLKTLIAVQESHLLLWIIDSAPVFLGLFALKAGLTQEKVNRININLEKRIQKQIQGIKTINTQLRAEIKNRQSKEQKLVAAMEEAQQGVIAKDQFLSNMSHEIRTPMNGVRGMTDLLLKTDLSPLQAKYLKAIDYSSKNLLVIINDILDLSKINSEKLEIEKINFNLSEILDSVQKTFEFKTKEKAIEFKLDLDPNIPEKLCGDPTRISQILLNIVGNAVKFTETGSVTLNCYLKKQSRLGYCIAFDVIDTGIGIKKENIKNVFKTFSQANSTITRKFGGTGLGLPISKKLIELQGGTIGIKSKPGQGTTFSFTLELGEPLPETKPLRSAIKIDVTKEQKSKIKILLAEDNKINQLVAVKFLDRFGFKSDIANNGKEAVEKMKNNDYDLVLMDIQMPEMDGLQASRIIKSNLKVEEKDTKIMAMTASVLKKEIKKCYDAGMDDYIPKPFNPDELYDKIVSLVF